MKTVKQFIEELQKLDQDKSIWIYYGHCGDYFEPDINIATGEEFVSTVAEEIHKNDYIILV